MFHGCGLTKKGLCTEIANSRVVTKIIIAVNHTQTCCLIHRLNMSYIMHWLHVIRIPQHFKSDLAPYMLLYSKVCIICR